MRYNIVEWILFLNTLTHIFGDGDLFAWFLIRVVQDRGSTNIATNAMATLQSRKSLLIA